MAAITWRNIEAPDFTGASRIMGESQRMLDSGFGKLGQIIEQQQQVQQANMLAERNNNTSKYLDSVAALAQQGPGKLEEAIKTGAISKLRESFGPNIDADKVRGAAENMLSQRMQQARQATEFNNFMVDEAQKPIRDAWRVAGLRGDKQKQAELEQANPNLRNMAELYQSQRNIDHENVVWDEEKKEFVRRQGKYEQDILASNAQIAYNAGMLGVARANSAINASESKERIAGMKEDRAFRAEDRLNKQLLEVTEKYRDTFGNSATSDKALTALQAAVKGLPAEAQALAMKAGLAAQKLPGATVGGMLAAALGTGAPEYFSTDGGQVNRGLKAAEFINTTEAAGGKAEANEIAQGVYGNRMKAIRAQLETMGNGGVTPDKSKPTGSPQQRAAQASKEGRGMGSGNYPIEEVTDEAAERAVQSLRDRVTAQAKVTTSPAKVNSQYSSQFGPEAEARREAAYQAKLAERQKKELATREAQKTYVEEAKKRNNDMWERQAKLNSEARARMEADTAKRRETKVIEAEATVRMMEDRVKRSGAPIHRANLEDAKEELRRLRGK